MSDYTKNIRKFVQRAATGALQTTAQLNQGKSDDETDGGSTVFNKSESDFWQAVLPEDLKEFQLSAPDFEKTAEQDFKHAKSIQEAAERLPVSKATLSEETRPNNTLTVSNDGATTTKNSFVTAESLRH